MLGTTGKVLARQEIAFLARLTALVATSMLVSGSISVKKDIIAESLVSSLVLLLVLLTTGVLGGLLARTALASRRAGWIIDVAAGIGFIVAWCIVSRADLVGSMLVNVLAVEVACFGFLAAATDQEWRCPSTHELATGKQGTNRSPRADAMFPVAMLAGVACWFIVLDDSTRAIGSWIAIIVIIASSVVVTWGDLSKPVLQPGRSPLVQAFLPSTIWRMIITMLCFILFVVVMINDLFYGILKFILPEDEILHVIPGAISLTLAAGGMVGGAALAVVVHALAVHPQPSKGKRRALGIFSFLAGTGAGAGLLVLAILPPGSLVAIVALFGTVSYAFSSLSVNAGKVCERATARGPPAGRSGMPSDPHHG